MRRFRVKDPEEAPLGGLERTGAKLLYRDRERFGRCRHAPSRLLSVPLWPWPDVSLA